MKVCIINILSFFKKKNKWTFLYFFKIIYFTVCTCYDLVVDVRNMGHKYFIYLFFLFFIFFSMNDIIDNELRASYGLITFVDNFHVNCLLSYCRKLWQLSILSRHIYTWLSFIGRSNYGAWYTNVTWFDDPPQSDSAYKNSL